MRFTQPPGELNFRACKTGPGETVAETYSHISQQSHRTRLLCRIVRQSASAKSKLFLCATQIAPPHAYNPFLSGDPPGTWLPAGDLIFQTTIPVHTKNYSPT